MWWNWQTRYFEVVVPQGVQVQILLSPPTLLPPVLCDGGPKIYEASLAGRVGPDFGCGLHEPLRPDFEQRWSVHLGGETEAESGGVLLFQERERGRAVCAAEPGANDPAINGEFIVLGQEGLGVEGCAGLFFAAVGGGGGAQWAVCGRKLNFCVKGVDEWGGVWTSAAR